MCDNFWNFDNILRLGVGATAWPWAMGLTGGRSTEA
jgi:hypothetical protein